MSPEDKKEAALETAAEAQKDPNKVTLTINDQEVEKFWQVRDAAE